VVGRLYYDSASAGVPSAYAERNSQGEWVSHVSPLPDTATSFSPDGSLVAAMTGGKDGELVTMRPDGTGVAPATWATPGSSTPIAGAAQAQWIDDTHLVFTVPVASAGGQPTGHLYLSDLSAKTSGELFANDPGCAYYAISVNPMTKDIAFDCSASGGTDTWVSHYDAAAGRWADPTLLLAKASAPDYSPDGKYIVFGYGVDVTIANADGTGRRQVFTPPGGLFARQAKWSPDGTLIAVEEIGYGASSIQIVTPSGNSVATIGDDQHLAGAPLWQPHPWNPPTPPPNQPQVHRIGGSDRYATGRLVSQAQWPAGTADAVVLARGDAAPDALAGVPLAARVHGPLLLTDPEGLDPATRREIDRVLGGPGAHKTVYILGGKNAVSPDVEAGLRSAGYTVVRYGGANRYETALRIAATFGPTSRVIVTTGRNFPDALSAGPLSVAEHAPIVLSDGTGLDPATAAFIEQHTAVDPVGGPAQSAVDALHMTGKTIDRSLAGSDRYATAADVAGRLATVIGRAPAIVGIASGTTFPDALTGGAFIASAGGALMLTDQAVLSSPTQAMLTSWQSQLSMVQVFGGPAAVGDNPFASVVAAVHGKRV
jgi:putative cell wall-binding protein/Tol biopolymer transport system component